MKEKLTAALNSHSRSSKNDNNYKYNNKGDSTGNRGSTSCSANFDDSIPLKVKDSKLDLLKSKVNVRKVDFPTIPHFEILDLDVSTQPKTLGKSICKISCKDALLQIQTEIEANSLLLYTNSSPNFTTPTMISNDTFTIPITMTFSQIQMEAITNIFVKNSGIGISFNDLSLDFQFDCSIKLLQPHIAKRLKKSMQLVFKEMLPSVIFNMSKSWFTNGDKSTMTNNTVMDPGQCLDDSNLPSVPSHKLTAEELELNELSPVNMLKLSTLTSSRQTLSLHSIPASSYSTIPGCLDRQNFHKFNSRIPSLSNSYQTVDNNLNIPQNKNSLPKEMLETANIDLQSIISVQNRIYERANSTNDDFIRPRRRKIRIQKNKEKMQEKTEEISQDTTEIASFGIDEAIEGLELFSNCENISAMPSSSSLDGVNTELKDEVFNSLALSLAPTSTPTSPMLSEISRAGFPRNALVSSPRSPLDTIKYFTTRPDLHKIHASFYLTSNDSKENGLLNATSAGNIYYRRRSSPKPSLIPFMEKPRTLSIIGLNNKLMPDLGWSGDDQPPPYC